MTDCPLTNNLAYCPAGVCWACRSCPETRQHWDSSGLVWQTGQSKICNLQEYSAQACLLPGQYKERAQGSSRACTLLSSWGWPGFPAPG